jgi:2-polyprenyl-6-hydroxyphenyl methylase/3-demethylubiquinone-9 3-methyltransferase
LPFKNRVFDAVVAVEVFEHLADLDAAMAECARVCHPMGSLVVIDKNRRALDARRPWLPAAVVKRIDERRGRWMYPYNGPVRERWFTIGEMKRKLRARFDLVEQESLLQPSEIGGWVFRAAPQTRLFVLWTAKRAKGVT